jgi:aldose 1-epimerase
MSVSSSICGTYEGTPIDAFDIAAGGTRIRVITLGAILSQVHVPDRNGISKDIALGYDDPADYMRNRGSAGAVCGRSVNRIANASFSIDGVAYPLSANEGTNHLHGGFKGFGKRVWSGRINEGSDSVTLMLDSPDGDEGYPGTLRGQITYSVLKDGSLLIEMSATTSKPTIVNFAHHGYWNLAGHESGPVTNQILRIDADRYTPTDAGKIPTGDLPPVDDTPFDFRDGKAIGADIEAASSDGGYDINFGLNGPSGTMRAVAWAHDPVSGRALELSTNQPAVQLYTANNFGAVPAVGKSGAHYGKYAGFALETQGFPDAPNQPNFPSTILRPAETYRHDMHIRFLTGA